MIVSTLLWTIKNFEDICTPEINFLMLCLEVNDKNCVVCSLNTSK